MVLNLERYNRQIRLFKEKGQKKLLKSRVALVGAGKLSDFILADLLSLGIGDITRIGYSNFFEFNKINPEVHLEQIDEELSSFQLAEMYLANNNFVIDATNNPKSKFFSSTATKNANAEYLSASSSGESFSILINEYEKTVDFHEKEYYKEQGNINSIICSAILTDELRKKITPIKNDSLLENFIYSEIKEKDNLEKKITQIGAGAIGTFSALLLSLMNADLTIIDFDVVEEANLNRQFLFYDSVGKYKAEVLSERLKKYSKLGKIKAINNKVGGDFNPNDSEFIFSCVDNNEARYYLNLASVRNNIPLINGGSSISAGNAMPFFPGKTSCLDCQTGFKLSEEMQEEKKRAPGECFQPSLIISNQIIGGLMVDCLIKAIDGRFKKSNYSSGFGIFNQEVNKECYDSCKTK